MHGENTPVQKTIKIVTTANIAIWIQSTNNVCTDTQKNWHE